METRIAIIDLGSNSCRMTVFAVNGDGGYREEQNLRELCRLSEGMGKDYILKDPAMDRTVETLMRYRAIAEAAGCRAVRAFATAAVRFAKNQADFLSRVKQNTGIELLVIDGKTEAYYDFLAVTRTLPVTDCLLTDTGGGSTEFILIKEKALQDAVSLPLGAVLLLEQFGRREDEMLLAVKKAIHEGVPFLPEAEDLPICAMGGSARALTALITGDRKKEIHGRVLRCSEVYESVDLIRRTPFEERAEIPFMEPGRADIMYSGTAPVRAAMELIRAPELICCQTGLRDGVLFSMIEQMKEGT